jgi:hypothetical protein
VSAIQLTGIGWQAVVNASRGNRGVTESDAQLMKIIHDVAGRV